VENRKPDAPDVEYFVQTNHTKERPVMSILASIEYFVQLHFGDFFSSIEAFYLGTSGDDVLELERMPHQD